MILLETMGLDRSQQIHIAPQGYETERVFKSPIENNADKVVLLLHEEQTESGQDCLETVEAALEDADISYEETYCDFFDMYDILWTIIETVDSHIGDEIFVNLSTGSKITAISGMIACMGTGASPYYVLAEGYSGETISTGVKETVNLPAYPIGLPDQQYLEVMEFLSEKDSVAKKEVVEFVQDADFPLLSKYNRNQLRNMYEPVDREILDPLRERGYIRVQRAGQGKQVWLTDDGEKTLEIFRYMLEDGFTPSE